MELKEFRTGFADQEVIFREGEAGDCAYIIESGSVEVSVQNHGRKLVIATLSQGDLLGEMAIIDHQPRSATAIALDDTRLIAIPYDYVHQKIDCADPTVRFILQILLERYRDVHARLMLVFEGINAPDEDEYEKVHQSTSNVIKDLMDQYLQLQDRILSAVNTPIDDTSHDDETAWHAREMLETEQALTSALKHQEFRLHYQPIVDLDSKQVLGCEALIRWQHPTEGLIPPGSFIAQAESIGLIVELGYWIAAEACRFQCRLAAEHDEPLFVSINLSAKQFEDPELVPRLAGIMSETGVNPGLIKFEITESLLMSSPELAQRNLEMIKTTGAHLAIDDFGTGYSSFSYLHQYPFDTLKIDRAFVSTMITNRKSSQIVKTLVNLAHDLDMNVIAEGIETTLEQDALQALGAEHGQGFHYSRAVEADAFLELLK